MNVANSELSDELWKLSGWEDTYDLGFLLRKLNATGYVELRTRGRDQDAWVCVYEAHTDEGATREIVQADTPENAACKLIIELFQQGILAKEAA